MDGILKRNSTFSFMFGPFIKSTDGVTPCTGLTISSVAVLVSKAGSSFAAKDDANALTGTEDTGGFYQCRLTSTDLNTPGPLKVYTRIASALPVWANFQVVSSEAYNALWSTSGVEYLGVNVVQLAGSTSVLSRFGILAQGTAQQTDSTSITLASSHAFANDELIGAVVFISSGTGFGQSRQIVDYSSGTKLASVDVWATTPSSVCDYLVFAAPPASALSVPSVRVTAMDTNVISAAAVSDGAVAKISSGLATSTEVSSGFAAQTLALSTMATSIGLRATSTEVSSGFAAQTQILSTLASALSSIAGGSTLTASESADAVFNSTVDGAYTFRQVLRGVAAVLLGKASGSSGSTTVFRDISDTKARVTAVTDTSGNRSAITLDLT